ncbi:hypothetical protein HZH68_000397 [Vespula germanica]|uniref:Uncharacterized protein n=1 Tax=Vespula germanica TaxID=30212 RepID=A0A834NU13_VESGE|nr:hypothetical protein HZH68_000397 [Vespula germanica]
MARALKDIPSGSWVEGLVEWHSAILRHAITRALINCRGEKVDVKEKGMEDSSLKESLTAERLIRLLAV